MTRGRQDLPSRARAFSLTSLILKEALLVTKYGFQVVYFILQSVSWIQITKSDFLLSANAMVPCNVSCSAQLVSVFLRDVEFSEMVIYRLFC